MTRPATVLIIDDDAPTRQTLRTLITWSGPFRVLEADDGVRGAELARQQAPDLVLLDLMMPGRSGLDVCAELRQDPATREMPIIILSAANESEALTPALEAGADDFLRKPFSSPELRAKIRSITRLNRYKSLREERERFRWLLDRSLEPLLVLSAEGALVFANARARELFALGDQPGIDGLKAVERHFRSDPPDALSELRARHFAPGPSFAVFQPETEHLGARWFDVELQATESGAGELLLKFTDRTGWVRRELETWSFQHLVGHKLRTPLTGLGNVLDVVAASPALASDSQAASLLTLARNNARRLEDALLRVLNYHEALFRGPSIARGPEPAIPLNELLQEAARETGLSVITAATDRAEIPGHLTAVLRLVLREVFQNYAKFSQAPVDGLGIETALEAGLLRVRLFARGPVPAPEALAQIGRPYWQPQARFTGEVPGMGLGLATARLLLRSHGGDLHLGTDDARTGVCTFFSVPVTTPADPAPQ